MLTKDKIDKYVAGKGTHCPFCGGNAVFADTGVTTDANEPDVLFSVVDCDDCQKRWEDVYKLADVRETV